MHKGNYLLPGLSYPSARPEDGVILLGDYFFTGVPFSRLPDIFSTTLSL